MSASMAEVLAEHRDWVWLASKASVGCDGCDWLQHVPWNEPAAHAFAAHQAGVLAANGYGKLEQAWDEGYETAEEDHYGTGFYCKRLRNNPYRRRPE